MRKVTYCAKSSYEFHVVAEFKVVPSTIKDNIFERVAFHKGRNLDPLMFAYLFSQHRAHWVCADGIQFLIEVYNRVAGTSASEKQVVRELRTIDDISQFLDDCLRTATWSDANVFRETFEVSELFFKQIEKEGSQVTVEEMPPNTPNLRCVVPNGPYLGKIGSNRPKDLQGKDQSKPVTQEGLTKEEIINHHVSGQHYKAFLTIEGNSYEWLEALQYQVGFKDPEVFIGAVRMQADKYLSRCGRKDTDLQELKKALWYLEFVAAYIANGKKPIKVADIPKLLGRAS